MEKQERRPESRKESHAKEEVKPNPKVVESGKKMKEDIDKLVDEIDDVLEKNAEEFPSAMLHVEDPEGLKPGSYLVRINDGGCPELTKQITIPGK